MFYSLAVHTLDKARFNHTLFSTMSDTETTGNAPLSETKTIQIQGPKIYFCQRCGSESDGLTDCLHTNTTVGEEIRCLSCYRIFVQSEIHLKTIQEHIPVLVRRPNEKAES